MRRTLRMSSTARPVMLATATVRGLAAGLALGRGGHERVLRMAPGPAPKGRALVGHVIAPFVRRDRRPPTDAREWAAWTLVQELLAHHLAVDVVSEDNTTFAPTDRYSIFVGTRKAFAHLSGRLADDCVRVLHLQGADVVAQNLAELNRLVDLKDRRGIVLPPRRFEPPTPLLEQATCGLVHGNDVTLATYAHAAIPLYRVPTVCAAEHSSPAGKDFAAVRGRFLWAGGQGLVHSGLDRVLDAFVALSATRLTVCGDISAEKDFEAAYARALYQTPHIATVGAVDVTEARFEQVSGGCAAFVFPSCAEGQAAAVVAAMAAGLVPLVTPECGVDVDDCGLLLTDASVEGIRAAVQTVADLPTTRLNAMANAAWERARAHAPAAVTRRYHEVFGEILDKYGPS